MILTESDKQTMASYMRVILRDQVKSSWMRSELTREIKASGLLVETEWPGHVVSLSERGREFLAEDENGRSKLVDASDEM